MWTVTTFWSAKYRRRVGLISVDLGLEGRRLRARNESVIDVGPFLDLVGEMIDAIGIRGVYDEVFNVFALSTALYDGLMERGYPRR